MPSRAFILSETCSIRYKKFVFVWRNVRQSKRKYAKRLRYLPMLFGERCQLLIYLLLLLYLVLLIKPGRAGEFNVLHGSFLL